jgi:P27 family predicted phage terminase small subunit
MGRRGPRPQPTALRVLRGNPGKRPMNSDEPKPAPIDSLAPPVWLDPTATEAWRELAPKLVKLGLLTELDQQRFSMLCTHWSRWRRLCEADPMGTDHTKAGLLRREAEIVARLSAAFGLDPASRTALKVGPAPPADELDAFLSTGRR